LGDNQCNLNKSYNEGLFMNRNSIALVAAAMTLLTAAPAVGVGTWTTVLQTAPEGITTMLLLSDGSVLAQNYAQYNHGVNWYRLTPTNGSYIQGQWTTNQSMHYSRLYYSSEVLRDGRVFVAGAEYGTGTTNAEVYDPVTNGWTIIPVPPGLITTNNTLGSPGNNQAGFIDSSSMLLPDGRVMIAPVAPAGNGGTVIFDPVANAFIDSLFPYPSPIYNTDEQSWVKLPDQSILTFDESYTSQRFIPSDGLGSWSSDADVFVGGNPYQVWNVALEEIGPGLLLANSNAFFLGGISNTVIYTPSGNSSPGAWSAGPVIPNGNAVDDGPAAMMPNGRILCAVTSPGYQTNITGTNYPVYPVPTWFYEYDPVANSFATNVASPTSPGTPGSAENIKSFQSRMLVLPDGNILYSDSSARLYVYQPDPTLPPLTAGKPTITGITTMVAGVYYSLTGTLLNGLSAGAAYGDDAQMDSNYPIVRMTNSVTGNVYYARTYNWSSTAIQTGGAPESTDFEVPGYVPAGTYSLVVVANGNPSAPVTFTYSGPVWVDFTYSFLQNGSYLFPFSTLAPATNAVSSGGTIAIKGPGIDATGGPASSSATMTINTPMTITAVGGPATIGR
jgi:hypothetical protein